MVKEFEILMPVLAHYSTELAVILDQSVIQSEVKYILRQAPSSLAPRHAEVVAPSVNLLHFIHLNHR